MQSKVLCLLALASAAAGQSKQDALVPTLYWHRNEPELPFTPGCNAEVNTAYKTSINNCNHWGNYSFRIRSTDFKDCSEGDDDEVAVWHFDYYSGSTDCTGTSNTTMMKTGACYVFEQFSATFTRTESLEKSCELASITSTLFGADYIQAKYTEPLPRLDCAGTPNSITQATISPQVSTPYPLTAQHACPDRCTDFCCKEVDAECNAVRWVKRITTCKHDQLVFAELTYPSTESACLTPTDSKVEVIGKCYNVEQTSAFSSFSPPQYIGEVCDWSKGDFIIPIGNQGLALMGHTSNARMIQEVPGAEAVLGQISSGSSFAASLTTLAVAVLALFL